MRRLKKQLMQYSIFPVLNAPYRAFRTWRQPIWPTLKTWIFWVVKSREDSNYTYDLTDRCKSNLAAGLSSVLRKDYDQILSYFREIENDDEFKTHVRALMATHPERYRTDADMNVGRRMVWYAVARAIKPKILVETGVDQGLGAVLLCAALKRNHSEGFVGQYFGTDLNPDAGFLLKGTYAQFGKILYGDSLKSLASLTDKIDLFINDSDHSADYEAAEYELVRTNLSEDAVVLGDNSHVTSKLAEFSMRHNRFFVFMSEEPRDHWYRGAGIGVSLAAR